MKGRYIMSNLTHLFKVGQKVKINTKEYGSVTNVSDGTVVETNENYIIVHDDDLDYDGWYENGFNIGSIQPIYELKQLK